MKYMGSKARIAKQTLPIMLEEAEKYKVGCWVEPFVGGTNVIKSVPDQQNQQVITSAKQEDDKVVLSALKVLAILLAFIVLWVFIYLAF